MASKFKTNIILLIGTSPPPVGGISVHLSRFISKFETSFGLNRIYLIDPQKKCLFDGKKKKNLWCGIILFLKAKVIHIHISTWPKILIIGISKLLLKKVIYTHHNVIFDWTYKITALLSDHVIFVNNKDIPSDILKDSKKYHYIPAFIAPTEDKPLPESLLNTLSHYEQTIITNCYGYSLINNKHLYGFDLVISAFQIVCNQNRHSSLLLILLDPNGEMSEYVSRLQKEHLIPGNCKILYICQNDISFSSLIQKSNIVLRATRTDGDSLTVRESLYYGKPVIASDIVWRPNGTILYNTEDYVDLAAKIRQYITQDTFKPISKDDYFLPLVTVYKQYMPDLKEQYI